MSHGLNSVPYSLVQINQRILKDIMLLNYRAACQKKTMFDFSVIGGFKNLSQK